MVYDFIPLKQGLKPYHISKLYKMWWRVYDFIPLKQGLKRCVVIPFDNVCLIVYDFIPLKQGLKLGLQRFILGKDIGLWLYSIKTRIETWRRKNGGFFDTGFMTLFH